MASTSVKRPQDLFRRVGAFTVLVSAILVAGAEAPTAATGGWSFCTGSGQVNCIESVVIEHAGSPTATITTAGDLSSSGAIVDVGCLTGDCSTSLSSAQILEANANNCAFISDLPYPIYITAKVPGRRDDLITVTMNTGSFEPALSVGSGIVSTSATKGADGAWRYTLSMRAVALPSAMYPPEVYQQVGAAYDSAVTNFLNTAEADMVDVNSTVSVFPPLILRWIDSPAAGRWLKSRMCQLVPLGGAWMTANARSFQFGVQTKSAESDIPWLFKFKASAPHYVPADMLLSSPLAGMGMYNHGPFSGPRIINPADLRMWVPSSYVNALGYPTAADMQEGMSVSTEDGQIARPTVTASGSGFEINLGIEHYSSPNPTVQFAPGKNFAASNKGISVKVGKVASRATLLKASGLKATSTSKVRITVNKVSARYCRVSGTGVKALKSGTCRVLVSVKPKKGATKSKTVAFKVVK